MQQVFFEVVIMTVMIRDRKTGKWPFEGIFSDETRLRVRERLKSMGVPVEKLPPFDPPEDAVSADKKGGMYGNWVFTTKGDILRKKRERMEQNLRFKREYGVIHRRPLYVWVFFVPGLLFGGWWTYIIGRDVSHGGKCCRDSDLILRAMELFPVVGQTLFALQEDWKERERWMIEFAKRYQRGYWGGKPQGKAPIWGEVKGNSIERILGRAQWPKHKGKNENINTGTR